MGTPGTAAAAWPGVPAWEPGLGSETRDLPGYVVLDGGLIPSGGVDCFGAGFLPAAYQASLLRNQPSALTNVQPLETTAKLQKNKLTALRAFDRSSVETLGQHDALETAIANYEPAYRMQLAMPGVTDISGESAATRHLYGMDAPFEHTRSYGRQCLVARRLIDSGVRFVELTCPRAYSNLR